MDFHAMREAYAELVKALAECQIIIEQSQQDAEATQIERLEQRLGRLREHEAKATQAAREFQIARTRD